MTTRAATVRPARVEDAPRLGAVHLRVWRETLVLVAESEGEIIGFASSGPPRDDQPVRPLQLYALNVVAPRYGTGVGQRLLNRAIGNEPAYLWIAEHNPRARRFYEKNGFHLDGVSQDDERLGIRELRMVR